MPDTNQLVDEIAKAFVLEMTSCQNTADMHAAEYVQKNDPESRALSLKALEKKELWSKALVIVRQKNRDLCVVA